MKPQAITVVTAQINKTKKFQPQQESLIETENDDLASNPEKKRKISIWDEYEAIIKKVKP